MPLSQVDLQRAWLPLSREEMFCVRAWVGASSGTSVGAQRSLSHGGASGAACCLSALRADPTGDQGPPPPSTVCRPPCLTVPVGTREAAGPEEGQPHSLAFTQYFLLILNEFFCCVVFVFIFKLTTWKKWLGYLWLSCPSPASPQPPF